jgi:hypothetical protein
MKFGNHLIKRFLNVKSIKYFNILIGRLGADAVASAVIRIPRLFDAATASAPRIPHFHKKIKSIRLQNNFQYS